MSNYVLLQPGTVLQAGDEFYLYAGWNTLMKDSPRIGTRLGDKSTTLFRREVVLTAQQLEKLG